MDARPQYSNQDYTVGWLCALARSELTAARIMLDQEHKNPDNMNEHDENTYVFGEIGGHNVVVACMPPQITGPLSAQKLVQPLRSSFPRMKLHLFVGIGGGIPRNPPKKESNEDIHLGDVVVGWAEQPGTPAVVQYDLVRQHVEGRVEQLSMLDKPNRGLLNALAPIISDREMGRTTFHEHLQRLQHLPNFQHPGLENDILYKADYDHIFIEPSLVELGYSHCYHCDPTQVVSRPRRETPNPQFHQGTILSGGKVLQDPRGRDELSVLYHNAICIEMEAAGVTEDTHCLVIRGIADYADSHKYWSWQNYAAATAAAFAREILYKIRPVVVANQDSGLKRRVIATTNTKFNAVEFSRIMDQGEQHYLISQQQQNRTTESLTDALTDFAHAESMLRESSNDNPSLNLKLYFRLMTIEYDLSHNRGRCIDDRIQHIRRAQENGSKALTWADYSQKEAHGAQVRLEQAFVKGRMAELEGQKGKTNVEEIWRVKWEARRDMDDAMGRLEDLNRAKYEEYVGRVEKWESRLRAKDESEGGEEWF